VACFITTDEQLQSCCKISPRTSSLCSNIFLVFMGHGLYVVYILNIEFRSCARGDTFTYNAAANL